MQNSIWKLTALAGVVGIGFLVVFQAQRILSQSSNTDAMEIAADEFDVPEAELGEADSLLANDATSSEFPESQFDPDEAPAYADSEFPPMQSEPESSTAPRSSASTLEAAHAEMVRRGGPRGLDFRESSPEFETDDRSADQEPDEFAEADSPFGQVSPSGGHPLAEFDVADAAEDDDHAEDFVVIPQRSSASQSSDSEFPPSERRGPLMLVGHDDEDVEGSEVSPASPLLFNEPEQFADSDDSEEMSIDELDPFADEPASENSAGDRTSSPLDVESANGNSEPIRLDETESPFGRMATEQTGEESGEAPQFLFEVEEDDPSTDSPSPASNKASAPLVIEDEDPFANSADPEPLNSPQVDSNPFDADEPPITEESPLPVERSGNNRQQNDRQRDIRSQENADSSPALLLDDEDADDAPFMQFPGRADDPEPISVDEAFPSESEPQRSPSESPQANEGDEDFLIEVVPRSTSSDNGDAPRTNPPIRLLERVPFDDSPEGSGPPPAPRPQSLNPDRDAKPLPSADSSSENSPANREIGTRSEQSEESNPELIQGDGTVSAQALRGSLRPQLRIEKLAPEHAILGQPIIYKIVVKNVGDSTADQVVVEDRIPKGSTLTGTIPQAELVDSRLVWKLGKLKPDEERTIRVRVVPTAEGSIGSIATVNFVAEVAAQTRITAPKLEFDLLGPEQARIGEQVSFEFKLKNTGSADATGVIIRNLVPEGLFHPDGNDLEYEVGTLAAGESRDVELALEAKASGDVTNRAIVTADGEVNVEAESPLEILGSGLVLVRNGPQQRYVGQAALFENTVTNDSNRPIQDVVILETLPAGMEFIEASDAGQYNDSKGTVAWRIESLSPQESKTIQVKLRPRKPGTQTSAVEAFSNTNEPISVSSATRVDGVPLLKLLTAPVDGPLSVGDQVKFQLRAANRGNGAATNVVVKLTLPPELDLLTVDAPVEYSQEGRVIEFSPIENLAEQSHVQFNLIVEARDDADARIQMEIQSDQMRRPLLREEALLIYGDAP